MSKQITLEELKKHNKATDVWIAIKGKVYDVSKFIHEHPGGDILLDGAGKDSTDLFDDVGHSNSARDLLKNYEIGTLVK